MSVVVIEVTGATADIKSPFAAKDIVRQIPGRQWDATRRVWVVPVSSVSIAAAMLHESGFTIFVNAGDGPQPWAPPPPSNSEPEAMFLTVFRLVGRLDQAVHRSLQKALHPDVGGDTRLAQALNAAWDRHRR